MQGRAGTGNADQKFSDGKVAILSFYTDDGLYMEYFKHDGLLPYITKLFQICYTSLTFPSLWNKAIIFPIYKSGDPVNPLNSRVVALQCTLLKAYTSILNLRLNSWLEENNILKKEQLGFRKEHGCLEHALSLYLICKNRILLKKDTFMCFIDLKKLLIV